MTLPANWPILRRQRQLRISVRRGTWSVDPPPARMVITDRRLVLIIHGYNNREDVASENYQDFLSGARGHSATVHV